MEELCTTFESIHYYRIFGIAKFEIILILIIAYFMSNYTKTLNCCNKIDIKVIFLLIICALVIIGIIAHIVTGTNTMLNYYLGISKKPRQCVLTENINNYS